MKCVSKIGAAIYNIELRENMGLADGLKQLFRNQLGLKCWGLVYRPAVSPLLIRVKGCQVMWVYPVMKLLILQTVIGL
jgi:hypothetical protein